MEGLDLVVLLLLLMDGNVDDDDHFHHSIDLRLPRDIVCLHSSLLFSDGCCCSICELNRSPIFFLFSDRRFFFYFKLSLPLMISNSSLLSLVLGTRVRLFVHFCRWLSVSFSFLIVGFGCRCHQRRLGRRLGSSPDQQQFSSFLCWVAASSHSNTSKAKYWHWLSWLSRQTTTEAREPACLTES